MQFDHQMALALWRQIRPILDRFDVTPQPILDHLERIDDLAAQRDQLPGTEVHIDDGVAALLDGKPIPAAILKNATESRLKYHIHAEAIEAVRKQFLPVMREHGPAVHAALHERAFTPAIEALTDVAKRLGPLADPTELYALGHRDDAEKASAVAKHVATLRDIGQAVSLFASGPGIKFKDSQPKPSSPAEQHWLKGLAEGWQPWLPTNTEWNEYEREQRELERIDREHKLSKLGEGGGLNMSAVGPSARIGRLGHNT